MRINIMAVGTKMPPWVTVAYDEFEKRFWPDIKVTLFEIPAQKRGASGSILKIKEEEGQKIQALLPPHSYTIALDEHGVQRDTQNWARHLGRLHDEGQTLNFLIGGPDGLSESCLLKANEKWALSSLTFPHPLVRILLIEQLYRAFSLLKNHPYHRA